MCDDTGLSPSDPIKLVVKGHENKEVDFLKSLDHGSLGQAKMGAKWQLSPARVQDQRQPRGDGRAWPHEPPALHHSVSSFQPGRDLSMPLSPST